VRKQVGRELGTLFREPGEETFQCGGSGFFGSDQKAMLGILAGVDEVCEDDPFRPFRHTTGSSNTRSERPVRPDGRNSRRLADSRVGRLLEAEKECAAPANYFAAIAHVSLAPDERCSNSGAKADLAVAASVSGGWHGVCGSDHQSNAEGTLMAADWRFIRTLVITSAIALVATAASGQSQPGAAGPPHDDTRHHTQQTLHRNDSIAAHMKFGMMRAAAIDDDLRLLADDMNMFAGEMKIEAMARLITLLVGRLSIMREQMMDMHELMMHAPLGPGASATDPGRSTETDDMAEAEAGELCREVPF
jgi:hypothetical protein